MSGAGPAARPRSAPGENTGSGLARSRFGGCGHSLLLLLLCAEHEVPGHAEARRTRPSQCVPSLPRHEEQLGQDVSRQLLGGGGSGSSLRPLASGAGVFRGALHVLVCLQCSGGVSVAPGGCLPLWARGAVADELFVCQGWQQRPISCPAGASWDHVRYLALASMPEVLIKSAPIPFSQSRALAAPSPAACLASWGPLPSQLQETPAPLCFPRGFPGGLPCWVGRPAP